MYGSQEGVDRPAAHLLMIEYNSPISHGSCGLSVFFRALVVFLTPVEERVAVTLFCWGKL